MGRVIILIGEPADFADEASYRQADYRRSRLDWMDAHPPAKVAGTWLEHATAEQLAERAARTARQWKVDKLIDVGGSE